MPQKASRLSFPEENTRGIAVAVTQMDFEEREHSASSYQSFATVADRLDRTNE